MPSPACEFHVHPHLTPRTRRLADRTLTTGKMIDSYLSQKADLDDRAIHLLFSANRWERACVVLDSSASLSQVPPEAPS